MQAAAGHGSIQMRVKRMSGSGPSLIIYAAGLSFALATVRGQVPVENPAEHEREECQHAADYKLSLAVARKMKSRSVTHE